VSSYGRGFALWRNAAAEKNQKNYKIQEVELQIEKKIKEVLGAKNLEFNCRDNIKKRDDSYLLEIHADTLNIITILKKLKSEKSLRFTILTDLFGADFPSREKRFEIVYGLLSLEFNARVLLKVRVADGEEIPSVAKIFNAATWYEREVFDMFGVVFSDSPDLRRILTDYGFVGHPLRKDFPVTGHVQVKYDKTLRKVVYEPVQLDQDFRSFDFVSPWHGPDYVLPGDEKATK
jgi:NADH-quinone oxidoreductase subunit C